MTTLAIVGGGIVGRSLLYNLTVQDFSFDKIFLIEAPAFARPCSLSSTAVVAPRGVTRGHSALGDSIVDGYETFALHVKEDRPRGVTPVKQFTGAITKMEQFKKRYPHGSVVSSFGGVSLASPMYVAEEEAFVVDPEVYLSWLLEKSLSEKVEVVKDFVTDFSEGESEVRLELQSGKTLAADKVVLATGASSRFWKFRFPDSLLSTSKPAQGAFLEYLEVDWDLPSFSLTLEGHNLVYRRETKVLLIGSSTEELENELPPLSELRNIRDFLAEQLVLSLPAFDESRVRVGLREKAKKREPYSFTRGRVSFLGGLYKNGYILSLRMTRDFSHRLRERA